MSIALWSVSGSRPVRVRQHTELIEKHLEEWIQDEPSLVMDGLKWVARQRVLPDRSRPDLIGVSREGALVIAELKRGAVGVGTLAQALQYALWLGSMQHPSLLDYLAADGTQERTLVEGALDPDVPRELLILLIGTARLPELDEAASFMSSRGFNVPISIVTFTPFVDSAGQILLARDVEDHDVPDDETSPKQRFTRAASVERVRETAREGGVLAPFDEAVAIASAHGLKIKPWPRSITVVPPYTRGRTLIYLSPRGSQVHFGYHAENLIELYGATEAQIATSLGDNWVFIDAVTASELLERFSKLMETLQNADQDTGTASASDESLTQTGP